MYRHTGSSETFAMLSDALASAIKREFDSNVRGDGTTVYFQSSVPADSRNLYTILCTPTRRLSIVNLY